MKNLLSFKFNQNILRVKISRVFEEFSLVFDQMSEWGSDDGRLVIQNTATCQFRGPFCDGH